jgi:hypothetical protein
LRRVLLARLKSPTSARLPIATAMAPALAALVANVFGLQRTGQYRCRTKGCEAISPTGVKSCQLYLMVDETRRLMATSLLAPTNRV